MVFIICISSGVLAVLAILREVVDDAMILLRAKTQLYSFLSVPLCGRLVWQSGRGRLQRLQCSLLLLLKRAFPRS
jgi:hypothetical protein